MKLAHTKARQYIEQALDGLLSPELQTSLDAHLQGCAECRAFAADMAGLQAGLRSALHSQWPASGLPDEKQSELVKELQAQFGQPAGSQAGGRPGLRWLLAALVVAALGTWWLAGRGVAPATIAAETSTATAAAVHSATPTASATPVAGMPLLVAVPVQNVNCREGNSSQFEVADTLLQGEEYSPEARGRDELWVRFKGPTFQELCWVFVDNLDLFIDDEPVELADVPEELLPYADYPPTPTPSPTPTFTPEPDRLPQCSDGIDNDGDGRIDYVPGGAGDRECSSPEDDDEAR
ncbi:MAG: zf-HC2 domain-containing protein [Anaerolineales bacterium]|nr:zf-HC2 domain-containing protein [Anaerolineales bacterium]